MGFPVGHLSNLEAQDNEVKDIADKDMADKWANNFEPEDFKRFGDDGKIVKGENGSTNTEGF